MNRKKTAAEFLPPKTADQKALTPKQKPGCECFFVFYAGDAAESADKSVFNVTELLTAAADGGKIAVAAGFGQTVQNLCKTLVKYAECDAVAQ